MTKPFFLPQGNSTRLCIHHVPTAQRGPTLGRIVFVHPFAEEMNKSRRMAAQQSRALASAGFEVLQIDLMGCGDSGGEFAEADWLTWVQDVVAACTWLQSQPLADGADKPAPPLWLWGLRTGCLLAAEAAQHLETPCNFVFWAPTPSGKTVLEQFLRVGAAAHMASGNAKAAMAGIRERIAKRLPVEVAGYTLTADLIDGLENAVLLPPQPTSRHADVLWFELSTRADASFTPVATKSIENWASAGHRIHKHLVQGPSFWQTTEIEDAPELIAATTAAVANCATP